MKKNNQPTFFPHLVCVSLVCFCAIFSEQLYAQESSSQPQDSAQNPFALGKIALKNPESILSRYAYDPILNQYIYTETIGGYPINYPLILTPRQYYDLALRESMKDYFKEKADALSGEKKKAEEKRKNLLPNLYVNSGLFETIFGGNTIELIPQGSVAVDLGARYQKNDNPSLSPRNRSNLGFDFNQRINLSLLGKVGTRLSINANYDTQAIFDFQNLLKLEYAPTEDDIVRKIEVGNVSMPLSSSLITGAQSLFGVKTELQFGRTKITGVFSEQRSQTRTVVAQGGGTLNEFEIFALDYDEDRHFFLSQYFRDQYDIALQNYPFINSLVQITRVEVWVTNRNALTGNTRNIVALQDLGEAEPGNTRINTLGAPAGFFNPGPAGLLPRNDANDYDPFAIGGTSVLTEQIRDIATVQAGFGVVSPLVNQGFDYAYIENARKLDPGKDYNLQPQLGYLSLNQKLSNDEVLAVAFQYTYQGEVYQVGEFANDGVNATDFDSVTGVVNNNSLVLKLLKSNLTNVGDPVWDLMMKNIYSTGAFQLSPDGFRLNLLYTDPSPVNYISPVDDATWPAGLEERILLDVFHLDRLNIYNDPQNGGDGFFDFIPGLTVDVQNGNIIFTKAEPFGEYLFNVLGGGSDYDDDMAYAPNPNQEKYVFRSLYKSTKAAALEDAGKNKFQLKGRYKSENSGGIPIGAFNVPQGSVKVTAGGRILQEGIDYTVNYQGGTVQILDEGLKASNTPIEVSVENNALFGQQTRRFTGINVEHRVSDKFLVGGTLLNLSERPLTQKANFGSEPVNNTIFGFNTNFSTELPFLTRLLNKIPTIKTDVPSNLSVRGELAYLLPGSPKNADFRGETTAYLDDFEGAQALLDMKSPQAWMLASTPLEFVPGGQLYGSSPDDTNNLLNGYGRAKIAWYTIDPIFYTTQRPAEISDADVSTNETRRIFIDELFPRIDVAQGQTTVQNTLDLAYYPQEKGPYNNNPTYNTLMPNERWGGLMRSINSTNFEQANVEYIQFWVLDPYTDGLGGTGGELVFNLGNISEDILKDGRKQYENGLPGTVSNDLVAATSWGKVPSAQSLIYAFDESEANRNLQDVGFDGLSDNEEISLYDNNPGTDPALDNYEYYLNTSGSILERYRHYNNPDGNAPVTVSNTNRGATTLPDVEDINRDQTMNTINSYYEYRIPITPNIQLTDPYVTDIRETTITAPDNSLVTARWIQFKIPLNNPNAAIGGISDFRSISLMRMYLTGFQENMVLRFGTLDLVRGDWRAYREGIPAPDPTYVDVNAVNIQENENRSPIPYVLPPGVAREQLNNNNTIIRQNEQSLSFTVCDLQPQDSRGVFKNINIDLRQYKRLKMFLHAEEFDNTPVGNNDLVAFIRIGTDFTNNYYQVEIPLSITPPFSTTAEAIWPALNEMNVPLELLARIKSQGIADQTLGTLTFYDENANVVPEFAPRTAGALRIGLIGNPSLGAIRSLMVGIKNATGADVCGEVWFNELRLEGLDNKGGWAAIAAVDGNIADFANLSATGRISTSGFGALEQTPNERSRETLKQYDLVTNINLGQLLPQKWGIQIPFNYAHAEELITPEFDAYYEDLKLKNRIDAAANEEERDQVRKQSESYTRRQSINFIGLRRNRGAEEKPNFFDIENFTFNYAYNETHHRDFEVENLQEQNIRTGFLYNYTLKPLAVEPFKKADSLFTGKYWQWLKELNINLLPASISLNSNITRSFNQQKFREVFIEGGVPQLGLPTLQQRNFLFDWQYAINYNLTKSLRLNFTASNYHIVKNYFEDDGSVRQDLGIWDGFWDTGDANRHSTKLQLNYEIPINKIPAFSFINASYSYTGDFDWQRGSDVLLELAGEEINTIQNANTHNFTTSLTLTKLYEYMGLKRKNNNGKSLTTPSKQPDAKSKTPNLPQKKENKALNTLLDMVTMVKRFNLTYTENNGKALPGYTESVGFIGTLRPTWGFIFGSQADVRYEIARKGWLTTFPQFNQQYMQQHTANLTITAGVEPLRDFTIDVTGERTYNKSYAENFRVNNLGGGQFEYENLLGNQFGNFSISAMLIGTAFQKTAEDFSETFEIFKANRLGVANRLALQRGIDITNPANLDDEGYPLGYGKNNQAVLLPAFVAAYTGRAANEVALGAFRNIPIPNWNVKYTGLMRLKWFQEQFKRFSLAHAYRASYSLNSFRTNLEYDSQNPDEVDIAGNFKNPTLYTNATLVEQFNPLARVDFETKSNVNVLLEVKRDRALSLSFDNNFLTEITGKEYTIGLGYRLKDLRFNTRFDGKKLTLRGDLNLKADVSLRNNITIIRNLEIDNNQVTSGQTLVAIKFTADYALSKNLTTLFFYDHAFSKFAISTVFPQTTIRSGITLRYNFGN